MHLVLNMFIITRILVTYARTIFITVKKPSVINAFLSFRNAFLNQKREREHFEAFQTVL